MSLKSQLLYNDEPAVVGRRCARAIGINNALVLQTVHFEIQKTELKAQNRRDARHYQEQYFHDGFWWIVGTYDQLAEEDFNFATPRQLRSIFDRLEEMGLVISEPIVTNGGREHKDKPGPAGKRYRIDHEAVNRIAGNEAEADRNGTVRLTETAGYPDQNGSLHDTEADRNGTVRLTETAASFPIKNSENPGVGEILETTNSNSSTATPTEKNAESVAAAAAVLIRFGVWEEDAKECASLHSLEHIQQQIAALSFRVEKPTNAAALLKSVLLSKRPLPAAYLAKIAQDKKEQDFQKRFKPTPLKPRTAPPAPAPHRATSAELDEERREVEEARRQILRNQIAAELEADGNGD